MVQFISLIVGVLFGAGLAVSQMINPEKVLGFLNITQQWDPSLIFVMVAAIAVMMLGYFLLIKKRNSALLNQPINLPTKKQIDKPLIFGAILFGIGWGIAGICPGPAIANILAWQPKIYIFIIMMFIGMKLIDVISHYATTRK